MRNDDDGLCLWSKKMCWRAEWNQKTLCYSGYMKENTTIVTGLTLDLSPVVNSNRAAIYRDLSDFPVVVKFTL